MKINEFSFVALILLLASCSQESPETLLNSKQSSPEKNQLSKSLPYPYNSFAAPTPGGACQFEKPIINNDRMIGIAGWYVMDSIKGEIPEKVILNLSNKTSNFYLTVKETKREDVSKFFNKTKLLNSGFEATFKLPSTKYPLKVTALSAFQGRLYSCTKSIEIND